MVVVGVAAFVVAPRGAAVELVVGGCGTTTAAVSADTAAGSAKAIVSVAEVLLE